MALFPKETTKPYTRGLGDEPPEDPPQEDSDDWTADAPVAEAASGVSAPNGASDHSRGEQYRLEAPYELRSIRDIVSDLAKPISPRHIRQRKQGSQTINFIEWHIATRYLDHYAPGWYYEIRQLEVVRATDESKTFDRLVLIVRIGIPAAEGVIWREATGYEFLNTDSYGDPSSNAEAMALKRAAAKFQLGVGLYDK